MKKNLKVMFINMPLREKVLPNNLPMGPALLAAILREKGAIPCIVDLNAYRPNKRFLNLEETEHLLEEYLNQYGDQDLIALSGLITTLKWQENTAKIIRRLQPKSFLVSGGGLATELGTILLDWIPELDAIGIGEGDNIILEMASRKKLAYKGTPVSDLNQLPFPAYDLLEKDPFGLEILKQYLEKPIWGAEANNSSAAPFISKISINTVSSRGCPYNCGFCFRGQQGQRNYRARSAENLIQEAKGYLRKYKVDFIGYVDDNGLTQAKRIEQLIPLSELNIKWGTHARIDEADERLETARKAGCVYIGIGGESASPKIIKAMHKGNGILAQGEIKVNGFSFPKAMTEGIRKSINAGIHPNCTWIMGYPGETLQDLKTTVAFIKWMKDSFPETPVNTNLFTATAYPGTKFFLEPKVRKALGQIFGIKFNSSNKPVFNEEMRQYILSLDDATKLLTDQNGNPLNFSEIPDDLFFEARQYVDQGETFKILDM